MSRWGTWAPVVSALAVAGLVVGVSVALSEGGSGGPPALRLAGAAGSTTDAAAPKAPTSGVRFTGTLPTGPATAQVHDLPAGAAPVNRVRELASALGVTASPERVVRSWRAGLLVVRDEPGHPWSYGEASDCGPDSTVSSDGSTSCVVTDPAPGSVQGSGSSGSTAPVEPAATDPVATACPAAQTCATAGSARTCPAGSKGCSAAGDAVLVPATPPVAPPVAPPSAGCGAPGTAGCPRPVPVPAPAMTEDEAVAATQRLRTALGLSSADVRAFPYPDGASVTVDPRVDGLRTRGIATHLVLGADRRLRSASGWLADSRAGASYPLLSASEALDRLAVPALGMPCDATADCAATSPLTLTTAELALVMTSLQDEQAALVPSWLFAGGTAELTQLAVREDHVTEPTDPAPQGTEPPPADPGRVEPGPARSPLAFDGAVLVDGALSVRYGSVCVAGVTADAKEDADSVTVVLQQDTPPPDQACIELYQPTFVPIALSAPLGSRRVVDAATGRAVTVVTCPSAREMCPR